MGFAYSITFWIAPLQPRAVTLRDSEMTRGRLLCTPGRCAGTYSHPYGHICHNFENYSIRLLHMMYLLWMEETEKC